MVRRRGYDVLSVLFVLFFGFLVMENMVWVMLDWVCILGMVIGGLGLRRSIPFSLLRNVYLFLIAKKLLIKSLHSAPAIPGCC
jgi:hypothetical protein